MKDLKKSIYACKYTREIVKYANKVIKYAKKYTKNTKIYYKQIYLLLNSKLFG